MVDITKIDDAYHWNLSKIATAFGIHRDTVKKRIVAAKIPPAGRKGTALLYALKDVGPILFHNATAIESEEFDVDKLHPKDRKDWFQSENERLKFEEKTGDLVPKPEHREGLVKTLKKVVSFFDSLPDKMERKRSFSPAQLEELEAVMDKFRGQLYQDLKEAAKHE